MRFSPPPTTAKHRKWTTRSKIAEATPLPRIVYKPRDFVARGPKHVLKMAWCLEIDLFVYCMYKIAMQLLCPSWKKVLVTISKMDYPIIIAGAGIVIVCFRSGLILSIFWRIACLCLGTIFVYRALSFARRIWFSSSVNPCLCLTYSKN